MGDWTLGAVEGRFASLIWEQEPLSSGALVKLCEQELGWKKSTTYTVLKKLCDKGLFQNQNGTVTSKLSKEEFLAVQSEQFVSDTFDGSLPAFVAAFSSRKTLSEAELEELHRMIDTLRKG
ncbi:MAG: BlaI/MecI/CopY family transcriptional regulator [Clostridia bacterium]|nr:BlaI/MecI/CopY family transcriptional regulator [Clostridia bacterium]